MATSKKYNKGDIILKNRNSLNKEINWSSYNHASHFEFVCEVVPDREKEELTITNKIDENMKKSCVYVMVIENKVFKIGVALSGIKGRIGSYNTGKNLYRIKGTNSGTNHWVLQSLLNFNKKVSFYAYYPEVYDCEIFGETIVGEPFPSAKSVERVLIRQFEEKYSKKPIGCTQG